MTRATRRQLLRRAAGGAVATALARWPDIPLLDGPLPGPRLRSLRAAVRGPVLAPGDAGYDAARVIFNRRFDGVRPPAVVRAADAADVQAVVRWAARNDVPLVARSGGHAYQGASTSAGAVVVDLGALTGVAVRGGRVRLGPGGRLLPVQAALARRGVTIPAGSCPSVGIGGLALGGGVGLAGRAYGLTLDRIREIDVVTADGRRRRVDARRDEDLFWALRGGGGSFGIVTAFELAPVRARPGAWFRISYPAGARAAAVGAFDAFAPEADPRLMTILSLTASSAMAFGQYLGPEPALRSRLAPLLRVEGASLSTGSASHMDLLRRWAGCTEPSILGCTDVGRTTFDASSLYVFRRLDAAGREAFARAADTGAGLLLDAYGGAIGRVDDDATAFAHREARFSVQILSYTDPVTARDRVRRARALLAPHGRSAYPNYPSLDLRDPLRAYYGANLRRLRAVKAAVDPDGRFRPAQGVTA